MNKFKIGILGGGRGMDMARHFAAQGCEIVALCDSNEARIKFGYNMLGKEVPAFTDFDEFLKVEMDAVVIANYFHEHAPYVIKCFEKNINVFCECIANGTMAEGVMLVEAFKKTKSIFMLAENYPQLIYNREIKKVCDSGVLGKVLYAEGEYNHPTHAKDISFLHDYNYFAKHWRNYLPATYYITHSLGPLMYSCGGKPKTVSAFAMYEPYEDNDPTAKQTADRTAIVTILNHDGSVYRVTGCANFGAHHNSYRVCGLEGQIENVRGMEDHIMLRFNEWSVPANLKENNLYKPEWEDENAEILKTFGGHGGADFLTVKYFLNCLKENKQPEFPFDLISAVSMSSVAILGHRSVLENGTSFNIPDFEKEEDRDLYRNDFSTPFYKSSGEAPTVACCSKKDYQATDNQMKEYKKALKDFEIE